MIGMRAWMLALGVLACRPQVPTTSSGPTVTPSAAPEHRAAPPKSPPLERVVGRFGLGDGFSCYLDAEGRVWCWGGNDRGQLGDGSEVPSPRPVQVSGLPRSVAIAAGDSHACALVEGGGLWCWGAGRGGRLGDGKGEDRRVPVRVEGVGPARWVLAAGSYTCAGTAEGLFCWGDAPALERYAASRDPGVSSLPPRRVAGIGPVDVACASDSLTCAHRGAGQVTCWPTMSRYGDQGDPAGFGELVALVCGDRQVCGLAPDGKLACIGATGKSSGWGWDAQPREFTGVPPLRDVVSAGNGRFALDREGALWEWSNRPDFFDGGRDRGPERVGEETGLRALGFGVWHVCVLDGGDQVRCAGTNWFGQLGTGVSPLALRPEPIEGARGLSRLTASWGSTCGVRDGATWCWGTLDSAPPLSEPVYPPVSLGPGVAVDGPCVLDAAGAATCEGKRVPAARPLRQIDPERRCGLGVDGIVECPRLRLDAGSFSRGDKAAEPPVPTDIVELITGYSVICGRRRGGRVSCAKFGDTVFRGGDVTLAEGRKEVPLRDAVQIVSADVLRGREPEVYSRDEPLACAVRKTGMVACWSMGPSWRLRAEPVAGLRDIVGLSASRRHACARLRDGSLRCWGSNECGQLGDGTVVRRALPGVVVPVGAVDEVVAGGCHTCARTRDGEVWCWGRHEARPAAGPRSRNRLESVVGLSRRE